MIGDGGDRVNAAADHALLIASATGGRRARLGSAVRRTWFCDNISETAPRFLRRHKSGKGGRHVSAMSKYPVSDDLSVRYCRAGPGTNGGFLQ
jgi:hypothetical protein